MAKYCFHRLGSERFETLAQALLEARFRTMGELTQFGPGRDGGREATWTQSPMHPSYVRPENEDHDVSKEWVFQAKFHDVDLRGWSNARAAVEKELDAELTSIIKKHRIRCHKYILITNVPLTGARHVGTKDRIRKTARKWKLHVPEIEVWDATDLSRMLDADEATRTAYLDDVLPGDVLRSLLRNLEAGSQRTTAIFRAYLRSLLHSERKAKAEEAGDEDDLQLESVFVDLNLSLQRLPRGQEPNILRAGLPESVPKYARIRGSVRGMTVPSSYAFLRAHHRSMLLTGGPGVGKSTITQFLTLYHASRLLSSPLTVKLEGRLKQLEETLEQTIDSCAELRFPLRIELRRYAQWIDSPEQKRTNAFLARYLAERIGRAASAQLGMDDIFELVRRNPVLLMLDGLDEVPRLQTRKSIFRELTTFLNRCDDADVQIILSSRPQGYRGEFDGFDPVEWLVESLEPQDFSRYAESWMSCRIQNPDERDDARRRLKDGMQAPAVQQLASTLLQATVMLTIVRKKHAIPHARHRLYEKYVDVIFERERGKDMVREHESALRGLHEVVGYQLLCKMESAEGQQTLGRREFRACVQEIVQDYGPGDFSESTIADLVSTIVTLAQDRLCLLAGKGEEQLEVDFVIQPFREYFAAAYLRSHGDADPDRIYASLAQRRHVWGNVLQFYAASAQGAHQKNWIQESDCKEFELDSAHGVVAATRVRRGLLQVLPEFERPRNAYIVRAFENVLAAPTRWTWFGREHVAKILEAFARDNAFSILRKLFEPLSGHDPATLSVELALLAEVARGAQKAEVAALAETMLEDPTLVNIALDVALQNNLRLQLEKASTSALRRALRYHSATMEKESRRFLSALSSDQALDLVFDRSVASERVLRCLPRKHRWIADLKGFLLPEPPGGELSEKGFAGPTFAQPRPMKGLAQMAERLHASRADCADYLYALVAACEHPVDSSLYRRAAAAERTSFRGVDNLSLRAQLGPAPEEFESEDAWASARSETGIALRDVWYPLVSFLDNSWLTLFVRPDVWPHLWTLFEPGQRAALQSAQGTVLRVSGRAPLPLALNPQRLRTAVNVDQICRCVIEAAAAGGEGSVSGDYRLLNVLFSHYRGMEGATANELLLAAHQVGLPEAWATFIFKTCASSPGVDLQAILRYFIRHHEQILIWPFPGAFGHHDLARDALSLGSADGVRLAAFLLAGASHWSVRDPQEAEVELELRVADALCDLIEAGDSEEMERLMPTLWYLSPSSREVQLWGSAKVVPYVQRQSWVSDGISERFLRLFNRRVLPGSEDLRRGLSRFLEDRTHYPIEMSLAALNALLRLDEVCTRPLVESDWQRID